MERTGIVAARRRRDDTERPAPVRPQQDRYGGRSGLRSQRPSATRRHRRTLRRGSLRTWCDGLAVELGRDRGRAAHRLPVRRARARTGAAADAGRRRRRARGDHVPLASASSASPPTATTCSTTAAAATTAAPARPPEALGSASPYFHDLRDLRLSHGRRDHRGRPAGPHGPLRPVPPRTGRACRRTRQLADGRLDLPCADAPPGSLWPGRPAMCASSCAPSPASAPTPSRLRPGTPRWRPRAVTLAPPRAADSPPGSARPGHRARKPNSPSSRTGTRRVETYDSPSSKRTTRRRGASRGWRTGRRSGPRCPASSHRRERVKSARAISAGTGPSPPANAAQPMACTISARRADGIASAARSSRASRASIATPSRTAFGPAGALPGQVERQQVGPGEQHLVRRRHQRGQCRDRVRRIRVGRLDEREPVVQQRVDQLGLARHVAVERVRRHPEPPGERAHRQRVEALLGQQGMGGVEHGGAGQARPLSGATRHCVTVHRPVYWTACNIDIANGVPYVVVPPEHERPDAPVVVAWHLADPPRTETAHGRGAAPRGPRRVADLPRPADALVAQHRPGRVHAARLRGRGRQPLRPDHRAGPRRVPGRVRRAGRPVRLLRRRSRCSAGRWARRWRSWSRSTGTTSSPRCSSARSPRCARSWPRTSAGSASPTPGTRRPRRSPTSWTSSPAPTRRPDVPAVQIIVGERDDAGHPRRRRRAAEGAGQAVRRPARADLVTVPDMPHELADPDERPLPHAATVDRLAVEWLQRHLP